MASANYLQRRLKVQDKFVAEAELLEQGRCIVILAEPGAGKTELIKSLALQLGCNMMRASVFLHQTQLPQKQALLIDGIDEVAKIDESSVDKIIVKAAELNPSVVILTSRGSEWNEGRYKRLLSDVLHVEVITSRLSPLETHEQEALFEKLFPDHYFEKFFKEVERLDLVGLLGNPLFLNLFAEAFVETGGKLTSKLEAYQSAIFRLAKEENPNQPNKNRPSVNVIVSLAEEVYAKILLSGASGVSVDEGAADINYPYLHDLSSHSPEVLKCVLDTRLFRNESASHFVPVHKVVAEYCAAKYLIRRLSDASDLLSVNRLLSQLAPNGVTREELRGLIGWMAALAMPELQIQLIILDSYAILANGDPSQLSVNAKKILIREICDLAKKDPYFRRGDNWRRFNIDGFFTSDVIDEVKGILLGVDEQSHLGGLFLELLRGSSSGIQLMSEYESILQNKTKSKQTRTLALRNLLGCEGWDYNTCFSGLCTERSKNSIDLAAQIALKAGAETVGKPNLKYLMDAAFEFFKTEDFDIYNFTLFLQSLTLKTTERLLEEYHTVCECSCSAKHDYQCVCRNGSSKIIGVLLDKYFELTPESTSYDVNKIWNWIRNLKFERGISNKEATSVKFLSENSSLRNQVQLKFFEGVTDEEELWKSSMYMNGGDAHSGIHISAEDWDHIVIHAFQTNNVVLWKQFYRRHNTYAKSRGVDENRSLLRQHAMEKPPFMKAWASRERRWKESDKEHANRRSAYKRKSESRWQSIEAQNKQHLINNQKIIREGRHWGWLDLFARDLLNNPSELLKKGGWVDDITLPFESLKNSIVFIEENLPTFDELVDLKIRSQSSSVLVVLYAACLVHLREKNSLSGIDVGTLRALQTDLNIHWKAVSENDREALRNEVERLVFHSTEAVEEFARAYFEPQLSCRGNHNISLWWLNNNSEFETLRETIPLEWIEKFPAMPIGALHELFNFVVRYGDVEALKLLIDKRCKEIENSWVYGPPTQELRKLRDFWYIRSFFFIDINNDYVWEAISEFSDTIFMVRSLEGAWSGDRPRGWPKLSAKKLYKVLDAFIEKWPAVPLPSSHGSSSPPEEKAYRFLDILIWRINADVSETSVLICSKILSDSRFSNFHQSVRHIQYNLQRALAIRDFKAPSAIEVTAFLDEMKIASVEDLRTLVVELLYEFQRYLETSPTNPVQVFYDNDIRVDENTASQRVVDFLKPRLNPLGVILNIEEYITPHAERCDIVLSFNISGYPKKLVIEAKGQWNKELYTAATSQLYERYSHHTAAEHQGIYLVYWYGLSEKVANKKSHKVGDSEALQRAIEDELSESLRPLIDVVILDLEPRVLNAA